MLILLPIAVWGLLLLILRQRDSSWRRSYLGATLIWGVLLTAITEGLSLGRALQNSGLALAWVSLVLLLGGLYYRLRRSRSSPRLSEFATDLQEKLQAFPRWMLLVTGCLVGLVGITALIAPPNNWDAMAYHLPRVMHWMQNRSVGHYPTNYLPQLYQSPWSEFGILHLQVLVGSDRLANLVQWSSLVGCLVGTSLIAQLLGSDGRGQGLTLILVATLPMAVLQGSNTKNDLVVAFWLVCLAYYALMLLQGQATPANVSGLSASLGLALLTKGTAYIYVLPFVGLAIAGLIRHRGWKSWQPLLAIALLPLLLNLGHYGRNLELFGMPLASGEQKYTNDLINLSTLVSNLVRNATVHLVLPFVPAWNQTVAEWVNWLHQRIQISPNDPATTWPGVPFDLPLLGRNQNEDTAGNPGHLLISGGTLLAAHWVWGKNRYRRDHALTAEQERLIIYSFLVAIAAILFCLLLKWQPWHSRLHLPLFILFAPFSGTILAQLLPLRFNTYLSIGLIQLALLWICFNPARPLIANQNIFNSDRTSLYFHNQRDLEQEYRGAIASLQATQCPRIGLQLRSDILEYPIWVLFNQSSTQSLTLQHIEVKNTSAQKYKIEPFNNFASCASLTIQ